MALVGVREAGRRYIYIYITIFSAAVSGACWRARRRAAVGGEEVSGKPPSLRVIKQLSSSYKRAAFRIITGYKALINAQPFGRAAGAHRAEAGPLAAGRLFLGRVVKQS